MLIVTSNDIPGYRIEAVLGEVMGMTVRSANIGANFVASFRAIGGGEVDEYTRLVYDSRQQVMQRMWQDAVSRDYYIAASSGGQHYWVFRDRLAGQWFIHGVFA